MSAAGKRPEPAASPETEPPAGPRVPGPGDVVQFEGREATILKVHPPGGPKAMLDLVRYHNQAPEALGKVLHGLAGGWSWPGEAPPAPPSLAEVLNAARASGVRVPEIGETVLHIRQGIDHAVIAYHASRARVSALKGPTTVDLDLYANAEPPEDSREPDPLLAPIYGRKADVPHGLRGGELRGESWLFPDQWDNPAPVKRRTGRPCDRCQVGDARWSFHTDYRGVQHAPFASLCEACSEAVYAFAKTPPVAAEPATA